MKMVHHIAYTLAALIGLVIISFAEEGIARAGKLSLSISQLNDDVRVGEPLVIRFTLNNGTDQPVSLRLPALHETSAFHSTDLRVVEWATGPSSTRYGIDDTLVKPNESGAWKAVLNRYITVDRPGTFNVSFRGESNKVGPNGSVLESIPISASFQIRVAPGKPRTSSLNGVVNSLKSGSKEDAKLSYDMLLHSRTDGTIDLLKEYADDSRFSVYRYDSVSVLQTFLPDERAATTLKKLK